MVFTIEKWVTNQENRDHAVANNLHYNKINLKIKRWFKP